MRGSYTLLPCVLMGSCFHLNRCIHRDTCNIRVSYKKHSCERVFVCVCKVNHIFVHFIHTHVEFWLHSMFQELVQIGSRTMDAFAFLHGVCIMYKYTYVNNIHYLSPSPPLTITLLADLHLYVHV